MPFSSEPLHNHLLAALSPDVQRRLFPHVELVPLKFGSSIFPRKSPIDYVYFPVDSIVSVQYLLENGASTALSIVGNEGLVGINFLVAEESAPSRCLVQSAGKAYRLPRPRVREEFNRNSELMLLMLRYTQATLTQVTQTAVCNRHHSIPQQLCRWLLLSLDRLSHNHLTMTQEYISDMLGVRRESVTEAASELQQLGVISYARGQIHVFDRPQLEALVCECYSAVKNETDRLLHYLPQQQVFDNNAIPVKGAKPN